MTYPFTRRRFLGQRNLGQPAYPRPKGTGDHSMPAKRRSAEVSKAAVPQDPRGKVKAKLPEVQSRPEYPQSRRYADSVRRHHVSPLSCSGEASPRDEVTGGHTPGVGMSGRPKPRSRTTSEKPKIAYGARALWRRSLRSSPRPGKPATWRREAGGEMTNSRGGTRHARR